jgi:hypothetical protein
LSPILGIYASQISGHLFTFPASSYESISTVTVGAGGQSTISFTSIPSTYKHLQIRAISRSNYGGTSGGIENYVRVGNGSVDTGNNYTIHYLAGNGSTAYSGGVGTQNKTAIGYSPRSGDLANTFGAYVADILDYSNTSKYKTFRSLAGHSMNGSADGDVELWSGLWMSTSAINTIDIFPIPGYNFTQYSSFALYGIKDVA